MNMIAQLDEDERAEALDRLVEWDFDEARDAITRSFVFADFSEAFAFMVKCLEPGGYLAHHA
jgi:4a-hydroxytetrahydrobiopterin dehydratase